MGQKHIKRNYKDSIFTMLFKDRKALLDLFNAVNGTAYKDDSDIVINTLDNAIYVESKNDVSFILMDIVNMYEHQSTYTPNMPLRDLIYVTNVLKKYIEEEKFMLYSRKLLRIPEPRFVVFYNGLEELSDVMITKLSDSYYNKSDRPELELTVRTININIGHNKELFEKCPLLYGYSMFVETVRTYLKKFPLCEAVPMAIDKCIEEDILREFLLQQKAEVTSMCMVEYGSEEFWELIRRDERELAREEVREEVLSVVREEVLSEVREKVSEEVKKDIIQNMVYKSISVEQISEITGMPIEYIVGVQKEVLAY